MIGEMQQAFAGYDSFIEQQNDCVAELKGIDELFMGMQATTADATTKTIERSLREHIFAIDG